MLRYVFHSLLSATVCIAAPYAYADLLYETNADGTSVTITGYTNSLPAILVIPTNINGLTVTAIGPDAFENAYALQNVTIPASITNIGNFAFSGAGLTNVVLPDSLTEIDEADFSDCFSLTNIVIPESVTTIGAGSFSYSGLTSIAIPGSVTNLGDAAFHGCDDLTNIVIEPGVTALGSNVVFANAVNLISITIPASVTNLGESTFQACTVLTNVFFEGNAPSVDNTVFENFSFDGHGGEIPYYITTAYFLPGTMGWSEFSSNTFLEGVDMVVPTVLWNPTIQATGTNFGIQNGQYGFDVTAPTNLPIAIEACDDLSQSNWVVLQRLTLTNGLYHFSEPFQTNTPARFYRIGFP